MAKNFKLPSLVVVGLGVVGIMFIAAILGYFKNRSNILPHKEGLTKTRVSALASALYAYMQEHNGLEKLELRENTAISNSYLVRILADKGQGENPHKISFIEPGLWGDKKADSFDDAWGQPINVFVKKKGC